MFFFISGNEHHYTYVTMAMHLEMVLTICQGTRCHETIQYAIIKVNCTTSTWLLLRTSGTAVIKIAAHPSSNTLIA